MLADLVAAFLILDFRDSLTVWSTVYYAPHLIMLAGGFLMPPLLGALKGKGRQRGGGGGSGATTVAAGAAVGRPESRGKEE